MSLTKVSYSMIQGAWVNVLDYGADNSGLTDSSSAFNAAIAALPSSGGTVYVPSGQYALNIIITKPNVIIRGAGRATVLNNNTTTPGTYCLDFNLPAFGSSVAPYGASVQDLCVAAADFANNYHGIKVTNCDQGVFENIYMTGVGHCLFLDYCYNSKFNNFFVKDFGKGIVSSSQASNNNNFENWYFFGGNASNSAQPIYDNTGLLGQNTFINLIAEGSKQQNYSVINGSGNTFIGCRWESCTQTTADAYIKIGGNHNRFINPLVTCKVEDGVLTNGYFIEISGFSNEIDRLQESGIAKRLVSLTATSNNNIIRFNTNNTQNQVLNAPYYRDFGSMNTIDFDGKDFVYNNEVTWSNIQVTNYFPESTDMSSVTTDGLAQSLVSGAAGRTGPFKEGLIQQFVSPTGNRRWYVDILPLYATAPATVQSLFVFSFWAKSLTSGGETISVETGATVGATAINVSIPDDKYVRVMIPFNTSNAAPYSNLYVGMQLPALSAGIAIYGCQVVDCGARGANFPSFYAGGYVPTAAAARFVIAPNYSLTRAHKISPANAAASVGTFIQNFASAVGQPKGWYCTTAGSPSSWTSAGNL